MILIKTQTNNGFGSLATIQDMKDFTVLDTAAGFPDLQTPDSRIFTFTS